MAGLHHQAEGVFDVFYLLLGLYFALYLLIKGKKPHSEYAGLATLILVFGDSFHLIPRVLSIVDKDFEKYHVWLGIGKLVSSITMTLFYVFMHFMTESRSKNKNEILKKLCFVLAFIRIILCLLPYNEWTSKDSSVKWGIIRNLPFIVIGIIEIYYNYECCVKTKEPFYVQISVLMGISFALYFPVILFSKKYPVVGALMLPKTIVYIVIMEMCWRDIKRGDVKEKKIK